MDTGEKQHDELGVKPPVPTMETGKPLDIYAPCICVSILIPVSAHRDRRHQYSFRANTDFTNFPVTTNELEHDTR